MFLSRRKFIVAHLFQQILHFSDVISICSRMTNEIPVKQGVYFTLDLYLLLDLKIRA
jgi:hypothetical protein